MQNGFDFTTEEILDWELDMTIRALLEQRILIENHAVVCLHGVKIKGFCPTSTKLLKGLKC
jgi:hypothetical protein